MGWRWGYGADAANVRLILDCGRNLQQTIAYLTRRPSASPARGPAPQPYICSQTVWWRREYEQTPELRDAVRLGLDDRPIIIYANPERHCGCYNRPFWLEYTKRKIKSTIEGPGGHVDSIFFDNPLPYDCYCPQCREKFARFSAEVFGVELDLVTSTEHPDYRMAKTLFQLTSTLEFFKQVRAYIDTFDPTITISPNIGVAAPGSAWLTMMGMTEMVFCEQGRTFPPFASTVIDYKRGLACSHGLAVGQLLGLPELQARARASPCRGHEGGVSVLMYPEEHKLATAEALACDGAYIVSLRCASEDPIDDAPHHAVREAIQQSRFTQDHLQRMTGLSPAAVALLTRSGRAAAGLGGQRPFRDTCTAWGGR